VLVIAALALAGAAGAQAATINVTTTTDEFDTGQRCSLREAIWSANNDSNTMADGCVAGSGTDVINLAPGTYHLTRQPDAAPSTPPPPTPTDPHENGDLYGDLDVTSPASIINNGALPASIVGPANDRVLDILAGAQTTIFGVTISGGHATSEGSDHGGGILNRGQLTLLNSTISYNSATFGGGLSTEGGSTATLENVTLAHNSASEDGGGLSVETDGSVALDSDTISANTADGDDNGGGNGGGTFATSSAGGGSLSFRNTLLAGNRDLGGEAGDCAVLGGSMTSLGNNVIGDTTGCTSTTMPTDITNRNGGMYELGDNGGPTATVALKSKSPAVNHGAGCPQVDQRGVPHKIGGRCDIGAYELARCQGRTINLVGSPGIDRLNGTSGADGFLGLGGNDTLIGMGGKDGLCGGPGDDRLEGGTKADRLDGGPGTDTCVDKKKGTRFISCERRK